VAAYEAKLVFANMQEAAKKREKRQRAAASKAELARRKARTSAA
jgi:hypothetical protein